MRREKDLEKLARKLAIQAGLLAYKFVSPNQAGVPDRLFIFPDGTPWFIEFKNPNKKGVLSDLQKYRIGTLQGHNVDVTVCDDIDDFKRSLSTRLEKYRAA